MVSDTENFKKSESKTIIAPSILTADFADIASALRMLENCGADWIHCDVMDGVFVPNITFGIKMVADIKKRTSLPLDVHLMIVEPEKYVERFVGAGADFVTIHVEAAKNPAHTLGAIRRAGAKCGIVLSPDTPVEAVFPYLEICDMVLVMSVYPGFGGQKFIPASLAKICRIHEFAEERGLLRDDFYIEIDGGIGVQNAAEIRIAGANVLVAGNAVFGAANPRSVISTLRG